MAEGLPNLDSLVELLNGDDGASWALLVHEYIPEIPVALPPAPSAGEGSTGSGPGGNGAPCRSTVDTQWSCTVLTALPGGGLMTDDRDGDGIPAAWADCVRLLGE